MRSTNWRDNIGEVNRILDLARDELRDTFNAMVREDLNGADLDKLKWIADPVAMAAVCINDAKNDVDKFAKNANKLCKKED